MRLFTKILAFALLSSLTGSAQEISVSSSYIYSDYDKFSNSVGYEIGFNQYFQSNNRLGIAFSHSFKNADYDYIFASGSDGITYYTEVEAENRIIAVSISYAFNVLNKNKSSLYIGPKLGLSYFKVNEIGTRRPVNEIDDTVYYQKDWDNNKISTGFLLEYKRKIISDNISIFISTNPEVVFYSRFGLDGSSAPTLIGLINSNLGLKINL
jgi:hypothetical protein